MLTAFLPLLAAKIAVAALPSIALLLLNCFSSALQFLFGVSLLGFVSVSLRLLFLAILIESAFRMILPKQLPTNLLTVRLTVGALTLAGRSLGKLMSRALGREGKDLEVRKRRRNKEKI